MKLVFVTQTLDRDDGVLGFVPGWVAALARHVERLRVVALEVGDASALGANVDWRVVGRKGRLARYWRWRAILAEAFADDGFDCLLAHMVPRYALAARRAVRAAGGGLFLWYTHKGVDARLRRAERCVEAIFTASAESLRLETPKKVVTGHGIDVAHFAARGVRPVLPPRVLSIGRLTASKDPLTVLAATSILLARGHDLRLDWVGAGRTPADESLRRRVEELVRDGALQGRVEFHGEVPWRDLPPYVRRASIVVNASLTGSVDKVVLEAMAAERPILTCNESFAPILAELGDDARRSMFAPGDASDLADKLGALLARSPAERAALGERLAAIVARDHEVEGLCARLVAFMSERLEEARR